MEKRVEFHVLGPLRVVVDGIEVPIAARRQRALLVLLAINAGRVVPAERLIDQLWDGTPPPQGAVTLRSYVSNVRQALGGQSGLGSVLVTRGPGLLPRRPRRVCRRHPAGHCRRGGSRAPAPRTGPPRRWPRSSPQ